MGRNEACQVYAHVDQPDIETSTSSRTAVLLAKINSMELTSYYTMMTQTAASYSTSSLIVAQNFVQLDRKLC